MVPFKSDTVCVCVCVTCAVCTFSSSGQHNLDLDNPALIIFLQTKGEKRESKKLSDCAQRKEIL